MILSKCCEAKIIGEVSPCGYGMCSNCKEWSKVFDEGEPQSDEGMEKAIEEMTNAILNKDECPSLLIKSRIKMILRRWVEENKKLRQSITREIVGEIERIIDTEDLRPISKGEIIISEKILKQKLKEVVK